MSKNLDTKIRELKELRADSSLGSHIVAPARLTALAWAIVHESKSGRKVRCHNAVWISLRCAVRWKNWGMPVSPIFPPRPRILPNYMDRAATIGTLTTVGSGIAAAAAGGAARVGS